MWSDAYNDWLAGDEPQPENYSPDDWEKFEELLEMESLSQEYEDNNY